MKAIWHNVVIEESKEAAREIQGHVAFGKGVELVAS